MCLLGRWRNFPGADLLEGSLTGLEYICTWYSGIEGVLEVEERNLAHREQGF